MERDEGSLKKVHFELLVDDSGYPPIGSESLWAFEVGHRIYKIDSIPFFVRGVSYRDVVCVEKNIEDGALDFVSIHIPGGHSTLRVVLYDINLKSDLIASLNATGCSIEFSHIQSLISVDVPPDVVIEKVFDLLDGGEGRGEWEYEVGVIQHP